MYLYGSSFTKHLWRYLLYALTGSPSAVGSFAGWAPSSLSLDLAGESHLHLCLLQTYLTVGKDVVMVGLGDAKFQIQLLHWSLRIMHTGTAIP